MDLDLLWTLITGVALGVAGNITDRRLAPVFRALTEAVRELQKRPVPADLAAAVRRARTKMLLDVCKVLYWEMGASPNWVARRFRGATGATLELVRVDQLVQALHRDLADINTPIGTDRTPITGELLLGSAGMIDPAHQSEHRRQLTAAMVEHLNSRGLTLPGRLAPLLDSGWDEVVSGKTLHQTWFGCLCGHFCRELQHNPNLSQIFQEGHLAAIRLQGQKLSDWLEARWREQGTATIERYESLNKTIQTLAGTQNLQVQELGSDLDLVLDRVAAIHEATLSTRLILDHISQALLERKRRLLARQYAALDVHAAVADVQRESLASIMVGRDDASARLDSLLERPSGVLLVTGRAGFGKTTLLAHWARDRHLNGCYVAYHAFSLARPHTRRPENVWRSLLQQLYLYYAEPDQPLPDNEDQLRDIIHGLLMRGAAAPHQPLVLVLDGLDEADSRLYDPLFDPPFPSPLPEGVYAVASVRADPGAVPEYLRTWASADAELPLTRLSRGAIRSLAEQVGSGALASLAADDDLLTSLESLTDGFPLYLHYLLHDMVAAAATPAGPTAVLRASPKGFVAYVAQQAYLLLRSLPPSEGSLFALTASAFGPLSGRDLTALTGLTAWGQQRLPWALLRWLSVERVGGEISYTFAHPLLAQEFRQQLGAATEDAREQLLGYCRRWAESKSHYALRYYPAHLAEAAREAPREQAERLREELYALAENQAYAKAQARELRHEPDLFLQTAELALETAATVDNAGVMAATLLALTKMRREAMRESPLAALRDEQPERAVRLADLTGFGVLWRLLLVWELQDQQRLAEARAILESLLAADREERHGVMFLEPLLLAPCAAVDRALFRSLIHRRLEPYQYEAVCRYLAAAGDAALALELAQKVPSGTGRMQIYGSIIVHGAGTKPASAAYDAAMHLLGSVRKTELRGQVQILALALAEAGDVFRALALAGEAPSPEISLAVQVAVGLGLGLHGRPDGELHLAVALKMATELADAASPQDSPGVSAEGLDAFLDVTAAYLLLKEHDRAAATLQLAGQYYPALERAAQRILANPEASVGGLMSLPGTARGSQRLRYIRAYWLVHYAGRHPVPDVALEWQRLRNLTANQPIEETCIPTLSGVQVDLRHPGNQAVVLQLAGLRIDPGAAKLETGSDDDLSYRIRESTVEAALLSQFRGVRPAAVRDVFAKILEQKAETGGGMGWIPAFLLRNTEIDLLLQTADYAAALDLASSTPYPWTHVETILRKMLVAGGPSTVGVPAACWKRALDLAGSHPESIPLKREAKAVSAALSQLRAGLLAAAAAAALRLPSERAVFSVLTRTVARMYQVQYPAADLWYNRLTEALAEAFDQSEFAADLQAAAPNAVTRAELANRLGRLFEDAEPEQLDIVTMYASLGLFTKATEIAWGKPYAPEGAAADLVRIARVQAQSGDPPGARSTLAAAAAALAQSGRMDLWRETLGEMAYTLAAIGEAAAAQAVFALGRALTGGEPWDHAPPPPVALASLSEGLQALFRASLTLASDGPGAAVDWSLHRETIKWQVRSGFGTDAMVGLRSSPMGAAGRWELAVELAEEGRRAEFKELLVRFAVSINTLQAVQLAPTLGRLYPDQVVAVLEALRRIYPLRP